MSDNIEQLEKQVAELEQQVEHLFEQLAESKELIAEEALLAGYELGYLQAVVNRTEKELFLEQASISFDEVMAAPETLDREALQDLLTEIDTFDDVFIADLEQEEESQADEMLIEEMIFSHEDDFSSLEEITDSEVTAAVRSWLGHVEEAVEKNTQEEQQEELELA